MSAPWDIVGRVLDVARRALPYLVAGPPLPGPGGAVVDVPLIYDGVAVDRMHWSVVLQAPLPKGCAAGECLGVTAPPGPPPGGPGTVGGVDRGAVERVLGELVPVAAVEYRGPEAAWAVPLAWRGLLVAHLRVSRDGGSVVPDRGLTAELRRLRLL